MSVENFLESSPEILVVIVNYKTANLTIDCLRSLTHEIHSLPRMKVIVVDNDSGDGSVEKINQTIRAENWHNWVCVIDSVRNGGYAFGNNLGILPALKLSSPPSYFLLLNPDTIVRQDAVKILVDFMNDHPDVGIAGSRLEEPDGTPQCSAFRFHSIFSEFDGGLRLGIVSSFLKRWAIAPPISDIPCQTQWVAGASMMVRREVFDTVGLLDESYFMYFEEVDFCLQAYQAGWSCWYVPESRVIHLVGQSSGVTNTKIPPKRRPQYWFDSRQRFFLKNHGLLYTVLADGGFISGFLLWKIRKIIQRKSDKDPPHFLEDFWQNSVWFKRDYR